MEESGDPRTALGGVGRPAQNLDPRTAWICASVANNYDCPLSTVNFRLTKNKRLREEMPSRSRTNRPRHRLSSRFNPLPVGIGVRFKFGKVVYGITANPVATNACRLAPSKLIGIGSFNHGAQLPGR